MNFPRVLLITAFTASLVLTPLTSSAQQNHPGLDATGFQQNRDYFSEMPFEHIDTLSGSLILTFTDLVLPGNAGRELRFQHTFNSKSSVWTFGIAGIPLRIYNPPAPTTVTPAFQEATPALHMADGSIRKMAWYVAPNYTIPSTFNVAISSDFWKFDRTGSTRRLSIPNGDYCDYEVDTLNTDMLRVTTCTDAFGNTTAFQWTTNTTPKELHITQNIGADSRLITITMDPTMKFPIDLTYDNRTWHFDRNVGGQFIGVTPPIGPGWAFSYDSTVLASLVSAVTTPHGGKITYDYYNHPYEGPDPQANYWTLVVTDRAMLDRGDVALGSWHYDYSIGTNGISGNTTVTVADPNNSPVTRTHYQY